MAKKPTNPSYGAVQSDEPLIKKVHSHDGLFREHAHHLDHELGPSLMRTVSESMQTLAQSHFSLSDHALVDADRLHHDPAAGTATIPSEVANMTKNLIGGGVLSLSGGMALFANDPTAAAVAVIYWVVGLGAVFGYFCLL